MDEPLGSAPKPLPPMLKTKKEKSIKYVQGLLSVNYKTFMKYMKGDLEKKETHIRLNI